MSSINTSVDQTLLQYVQSLNSSQQQTPTQQLIAAEEESQSNSSQSSQSSGPQGGGIFAQIASAVTTALQSSNGSTNANQVVQNAIASVLGGQSGSLSAIGLVTGSDSDGDTDSAGETDATGNATPADFLQTLQKAGVSPQQFRQDLVSALQSQNGGTNDLSALSDAFPPGSVVDQIA